MVHWYYSWLVGDAKQAIYRWRGGNPQLLLTQVEKEMGRDKTCTTALRHNWRSKRAIVAFNNAFFAEASRLMTTSTVFLSTPCAVSRAPILTTTAV